MVTTYLPHVVMFAISQSFFTLAHRFGHVVFTVHHKAKECVVRAVG